MARGAVNTRPNISRMRSASTCCARWTRSSSTRPPLQEAISKPTRENLVLIHIDEEATRASNADATGGEPIFSERQGRGPGHLGHLWLHGRHVAWHWAMSGPATAEPGDEVEVMVLGQPHKARILHRAALSIPKAKNSAPDRPGAEDLPGALLTCAPGVLLSLSAP